jgi:hypothetical protein
MGVPFHSLDGVRYARGTFAQWWCWFTGHNGEVQEAVSLRPLQVYSSRVAEAENRKVAQSVLFSRLPLQGLPLGACFQVADDPRY